MIALLCLYELLKKNLMKIKQFLGSSHLKIILNTTKIVFKHYTLFPTFEKNTQFETLYFANFYSVSISSTATSIMLGNQIGRSETMEIRLYADYRGLGLTVDGSFNDSSVLGEAPVVSYVQTGSAADR